MRKKLDTRFPASRIKKIMQADEDVGKIAMAVPVLVSKALELFLQDLCDRTYDITVQRGAKTVNSLHLKHCVHSYNVFDFLREVVNKVPDYGNSDSAVDTPKRRKVAATESLDSDDDSKKSSMQQETLHSSSSVGRGRGRGRSRGRGRASRATERESPTPRHDEMESTACEQSIKQISSPMDNISRASNVNPIKVTPDESFDKMIDGIAPPDVKGEECSEMGRMAIDPIHLAQLSTRLDEADGEEDYDEED